MYLSPCQCPPRRYLHPQHRRMPLKPWLLALLLPLAGSALILALFAQANPLIEQFFAALDLPSPDDQLIVRLILWSFIGLITWGVLRPRPPRFLLGTFDGRGEMAIPGVSLASVTISLVLFNALFAMQNLMDSAFLWGGVKLPGEMTLADYAHRGAYPLLATALLAAAFVLIALRPGSQTAENPLVRKLVMVWIGQNLFLVGSAALRTWDYVEAYDLTRLRIAALLWMALVAVGLVLVLVRMLRNKNAAWLINANLAAAATLLFALCFVDTGTIAARWNLAHAREFDGTGAALDLCYLKELGPSALVPLAAYLSKLQAPGGVFACLGNHDQWNMSLFKFRQTFESVGIRVLINEAAAVTLRDRNLWLAGVESVWAGYPNPAKSLSALKSHERAIFLAHEPDYALDISRQLPIALQLSGHTHGGQICLPPGKVILSPRHGKILVRGIYQDSAAWPVYVNRGIGTLGPHLRVACRPEITLLQIENVS